MLPANKPKRVNKSAEERVAEILTAATRIFADKGYQTADVETVAAAAGVGKGTVYRYFTTKEVLFTEALRFNLERLRCEVQQARANQDNALEQLREGMRAYLLHFERNPDLVELFVQARAEFRQQAKVLYFAYMYIDWDEWVAVFERIGHQYRLRDGALDELMAASSDLLHGAVVLSQAPRRKPLSQRFEVLFDVYLHGILKP